MSILKLLVVLTTLCIGAYAAENTSNKSKIWDELTYRISYQDNDFVNSNENYLKQNLSTDQKNELYNRAQNEFASSLLNNDFSKLKKSISFFNNLLSKGIIKIPFFPSRGDSDYFGFYNSYPSFTFFNFDFCLMSVLIFLILLYKTGNFTGIVFPLFSIITYKFYHLESFSMFYGVGIFLLICLLLIAILSYKTKAINFRNKEMFTGFDFKKTLLVLFSPLLIFFLFLFSLQGQFKIQNFSEVLFWEYKVFVPLLFFWILVSYIFHTFFGVFISNDKLVIISHNFKKLELNKSEIEELQQGKLSLKIKLKNSNKPEILWFFWLPTNIKINIS